MVPTIKTRHLPRLEQEIGVQITATVRPDLDPIRNDPRLREKIKKLIESGVSHFRLNLSHFTPEAPPHGFSRDEYLNRWKALVQCIDSVKDELGVHVFIMLDTAGPEFRITSSSFPTLEPNQEVFLSANGKPEDIELPLITLSMPDRFESFGGEEIIGREVRLADGECTAIVLEQRGNKLLRLRINSAQRFEFNGRKNIKVNFPGFHLQGAHAVSHKDREHLEFFLKIPRPAAPASSTGVGCVPIDYVAQSFVRSAQDITGLEAIINVIGLPMSTRPLLIIKIESEQAIQPAILEEIVRHPSTAAIMVARGDLGNECERWLVPSAQREIIGVAQAYLKPVLIATEVYGSMGRPPYPNLPSRGEVVDLRYALEAGADGIVFTAETVSRPDDPETPVAYAACQARHDYADIEEKDLYEAERDRRRKRLQHWYEELRRRPAKSLSPQDAFPLRTATDLSTMDWALAAVHRANHRCAVAIFPTTVSGNTARDMAHFLPYCPILAITDHEETLPGLALFRNVYPVLVERLPKTFDVGDLKALVQEIMRRFEMGNPGDQALATMSHPIGLQGGTDILALVQRI